MPTQIIIEGDMVRTIEVTEVSQVRLEDLLPKIETRPPIFVGALPKSAKFIHWDESNAQTKRVSILAELEPGRRSCRYETRRYDLSIPWTYFRFDFQSPNNGRNDQWQAVDNRVFWAQEEATSLDSMIGRALVPNCDTGGTICYGTTAVPATLNLGPRVDRLVHSFYATTFTHDSGTGSPWSTETRSTAWNRWALESREDPHAWRRFPEWAMNGGNRGAMGIGPLQSIKDILGDKTPRPTFINIEDAIPPMTIPFTVGRAVEWFQNEFNPDQRLRMRAAMDLAIGEGGEGFAVAAPRLPDQVEDIGVPVPEDEQ